MLIALWLYLTHNTPSLKDFNSFKRLRALRKKISLRTSYAMAVCSLLLVIAIIPVFEFHRKAFNMERVKYLRTMQYGIIQDFLSRPKYPQIYRVDREGAIGIDSILTKQVPASNEDVDKLSKLIGPLLDVSGMSFLKRDEAWHVFVNSNPWRWTQRKDSLLFMPRSLVPGKTGEYLWSPAQRYHFPHALGWILGMIGLAYLFLFTRYLITRIFIFDINRNLVEADMFLITAEAHVEAGENEFEKPLFNNHLFIIGLPFSGKRDYVDKLYPPKPRHGSRWILSNLTFRNLGIRSCHLKMNSKNMKLLLSTILNLISKTFNAII